MLAKLMSAQCHSLELILIDDDDDYYIVLFM